MGSWTEDREREELLVEPPQNSQPTEPPRRE